MRGEGAVSLAPKVALSLQMFATSTSNRCVSRRRFSGVLGEEGCSRLSMRHGMVLCRLKATSTTPLPAFRDSVSELLRRWARNPLGSARRRSHLLAVAFSTGLTRCCVARKTPGAIARAIRTKFGRAKPERVDSLLRGASANFAQGCVARVTAPLPKSGRLFGIEIEFLDIAWATSKNDFGGAGQTQCLKTLAFLNSGQSECQKKRR